MGFPHGAHWGSTDDAMCFFRAISIWLRSGLRGAIFGILERLAIGVTKDCYNVIYRRLVGSAQYNCAAAGVANNNLIAIYNISYHINMTAEYLNTVILHEKPNNYLETLHVLSKKGEFPGTKRAPGLCLRPVCRGFPPFPSTYFF